MVSAEAFAVLAAFVAASAAAQSDKALLSMLSRSSNT
jgi:hypothetical protein